MQLIGFANFVNGLFDFVKVEIKLLEIDRITELI